MMNEHEKDCERETHPQSMHPCDCEIAGDNPEMSEGLLPLRISLREACDAPSGTVEWRWRGKWKNFDREMEGCAYVLAVAEFRFKKDVPRNITLAKEYADLAQHPGDEKEDYRFAMDMVVRDILETMMRDSGDAGAAYRARLRAKYIGAGK